MTYVHAALLIVRLLLMLRFSSSSMYVQHGSATITICSLQPNWTININLSCSLVWTAIVSMAMLSCARTLCLWNDIHILIMFTIIGHYWLSDRSGGGSRDGGSSGSDWFIYFVEIIYGRPVFAYNLYGIPFELYAARTHPSMMMMEKKFSHSRKHVSMHDYMKLFCFFQSMNK